MTKSQDRLPMGTPLTPRRVITSRFASRSRVFPLCRRLEDTGYFTGPPYSIQICNAIIAQHFIFSRKSVDSSALPQVRGGEGGEPYVSKKVGHEGISRPGWSFLAWGVLGRLPAGRAKKSI